MVLTNELYFILNNFLNMPKQLVQARRERLVAGEHSKVRYSLVSMIWGIYWDRAWTWVADYLGFHLYYYLSHERFDGNLTT